MIVDLESPEIDLDDADASDSIAAIQKVALSANRRLVELGWAACDAAQFDMANFEEPGPSLSRKPLLAILDTPPLKFYNDAVF